MLTVVGDTLTQMISWVGSVITALTTSSGALYSLLPLFCISIGIALLFASVRVIRNLVWGA